MKFFALTFSLVFSCSLLSYSQARKDALVLKNGSVIKGKLIEASSDYYRIKTFDGSILVYPANEVEGYNTINIEGGTSPGNKFGVGLETGFLVGTQTSEYVAPFGFSIFGIYRLNEIHSFSAGSGVEYLGVTYSPLFFEYSAKLLRRSATPFIFARAGAEIYTGGNKDDDEYGYYNERDYRGGPTVTLGTGINWQRESYEMVLSFAFRYIKTEYSVQDYYSYESTYTTSWKRLEVKLGFRF